MKLYAFYTPSHRLLLNEWFLPSVDKKEYKLVLKKEKQLGTGEYGSKDFNKSMLYKVDEIITAIKENWGKTFAYSDIDVQFLGKSRYIIEHLIKNRDIVFQKNGKNGEICAGFFACKGNTKTLKLWQETRNIIIKEKIKIHDQEAINRLLIENAGINLFGFIKIGYLITKINNAINYLNIFEGTIDFAFPRLNNQIGIKWDYLPNEFYCPGLSRESGWIKGMKLKIPNKIVVHHANWTKGIKSKVEQFKYIRSLKESL